MKKCEKCGCDISDRGNRSVKCNDCQKKYRKEYNKITNGQSNKQLGSIRYNKETYQWARQIKKLSQAEIHDLVSTYRNKLTHAKGREKMDIKVRIKILTDCYKNAKPLDYRGARYPPNKHYSNYDPDNIETWKTSGIISSSRYINWDKAKTGWTQYYDDGLVTLSPDMFFGKWKVID